MCCCWVPSAVCGACWLLTVLEATSPLHGNLNRSQCIVWAISAPRNVQAIQLMDDAHGLRANVLSSFFRVQETRGNNALHSAGQNIHACIESGNRIPSAIFVSDAPILRLGQRTKAARTAVSRRISNPTFKFVWPPPHNNCSRTKCTRYT